MRPRSTSALAPRRLEVPRRRAGLAWLFVLASAGCVAAAPGARPAEPPTPPPPAATPRRSSVEQQYPLTARRILRNRIDERIDAEDRGDLARVEAIDREIRTGFEKRLAVMVTDLAGFTARTQTLGIIGFLAEVRRLFHLAEPIIAKHGGTWVKVDADDLFVSHPDPNAMFDLADELLAATRAHNARDPTHPLGLSIGLGFGPTLVVEHDVWGHSVNTASKLGEDVGRAGDLLISEELEAAITRDRAARCSRVDDYAARGSKLPFFACRTTS